MTRRPPYGTLSTIRPNKEPKVLHKAQLLLGAGRLRIHPHANKRMAEREVIYFEILQALSHGKHIPKRDRFSREHRKWEYCIEGKTIDSRLLRIGIAFEIVPETGERLLIITVIDLKTGER
jgi:hypothetical protein